MVDRGYQVIPKLYGSNLKLTQLSHMHFERKIHDLESSEPPLAALMLFIQDLNNHI
jgi:hypothetical protein